MIPGEVKVLRGLPGSGKSYGAAKLAAADYLICSADDFHMEDGVYRFKPENISKAHGGCLLRFVDLLLTGAQKIVVDNTNTTVWEMAPYCALALAYDYALSVYTVDCSIERALSRNVHNVPEATIRKMAENMEIHTPLIPKHWNHTVL